MAYSRGALSLPWAKYERLFFSISRYVIALLACLLALWLTKEAWQIAQHSQFVFFIFAVMLSAWYGGIGPGLFATAISGLIIDYFLIPPFYSLLINIDEWLRLLLFLGVASSVCYLTGGLREAEIKLRSSIEGERTARAKAEQQELELAKREQELSKITNALPAFIAVIDKEHHYLFCNNYCAKWLDYSPDYVKGKPIKELMGEHLYTLMLPHLKCAMGGQAISTGMWMTLKDGTKHYLNYNYLPKLNSQGEVEGVIILVNDTTEMKRALDEIGVLNKELEERVDMRTAQLRAANSELEAFCYSVSHDLRAPLRSIDGFSRALWEDCHKILGPNARDYLQRIGAASQRMAQLIDDLLELSHLSAREMRDDPVNLSELAQKISEDLRSKDPQRKVNFIIAPALEVRGDASLLQVVLENLLSNAWKFTGKQTQATIEVAALEQQDGDGPIYYVRDDGAGFNMEYADRLFGAFQRLHDNDEFSGTGIGLALVKRVISRHGGRLWGEGKVGQGATFYFTLPSPQDTPADY